MYLFPRPLFFLYCKSSLLLTICQHYTYTTYNTYTERTDGTGGMVGVFMPLFSLLHFSTSLLKKRPFRIPPFSNSKTFAVYTIISWITYLPTTGYWIPDTRRWFGCRLPDDRTPAASSCCCLLSVHISLLNSSRSPQ